MMSFEISWLRARLSALTYAYVFAAALLAAYGLQLAEANDYAGYRLFSIDFRYLTGAMLSVFAVGVMMPTHVRRPSDFFFTLYGLFVVLPYATLYPIRNDIESAELIVGFSILLFPLLSMRIVSAVVPKVRFPKLLKQQAIVWVIVLLCIGGLLHALANPPSSAGFDLATAYDRRIEGRSIFPAGTLSAYFNTAIVNGFAPFLAFIAGLRRQVLLMALAMFSGVAFFYLLGLKAPVFLSILGLLIGITARRGQLNGIVRVIYFLIFGIFFVFFLEYSLFGFSLIGDYFVRRAFSVPPYIVSAYFEFISAPSTISWSLLEGLNSSEPIPFLVGESFLGVPGLNANTNAFLYQFASGGLPTYGLTILLIATIFAVLDAAHKSTQNPVLMYLGFSYGILLTEQAATTALVSSGIGLLIALNLFSGAYPTYGLRVVSVKVRDSVSNALFRGRSGECCWTDL